MQNLLLLHGALGCAADFDALVQSLSTHYHIHRFNFYGHSGEPLPQSPLRINDYVTQILNYMDEHELPQTSILGYSMGGYAALCFALQYPHRVKSLLTLATKYEWSPTIARQETQNLIPEIIAEKLPKYAAQLQQIHGVADWKNLCNAISHLMTDLGDKQGFSTTDFSPIENIPVQIMVGDTDKMVSQEESKRIQQQIHGARLCILPATPHPIARVRVALLQALLLDFFGN